VCAWKAGLDSYDYSRTDRRGQYTWREKTFPGYGVPAVTAHRALSARARLDIGEWGDVTGSNSSCLVSKDLFLPALTCGHFRSRMISETVLPAFDREFAIIW
jgi:hypothetical protein